MLACLVGVVLAACSSNAAPPPHREDRAQPVETAPPMKLAVTVDGVATTWSEADFGKVQKLGGKASSGEARDVWSLRDLTETLVSPNARVVSVTGIGTTATIAPNQWTSYDLIPILHTTRRGTFKFRWARPGGAWDETLVRDVTAIAIERATTHHE